MADSKELKVQEKQELSSSAEHTTPGPVFTPQVDIFETEKEITLLSDMPGVTPEALNIDLRDDTLTLTGSVGSGKITDEDIILTEYQTGKYFRQFKLSEVIDQEKINANMSDGVLRLNLPKMEKAQPRKITVNAG